MRLLMEAIGIQSMKMTLTALKSNGNTTETVKNMKSWLKINISISKHLHNVYATVQVSVVCQKHSPQSLLLDQHQELTYFVTQSTVFTSKPTDWSYHCGISDRLFWQAECPLPALIPPIGWHIQRSTWLSCMQNSQPLYRIS